MQTANLWWTWRNSTQSVFTALHNAGSCKKTLAGSDTMMILKTHLAKLKILRECRRCVEKI